MANDNPKIIDKSTLRAVIYSKTRGQFSRLYPQVGLYPERNFYPSSRQL